MVVNLLIKTYKEDSATSTLNYRRKQEKIVYMRGYVFLPTKKLQSRLHNHVYVPIFVRTARTRNLLLQVFNTRSLTFKLIAVWPHWASLAFQFSHRLRFKCIKVAFALLAAFDSRSADATYLVLRFSRFMDGLEQWNYMECRLNFT